MNPGVIERGILVRVDGTGAITIQHCGLTPVECMGLLAMAQGFLMNDLHLAEQKQTADAALLDMLKAAKVN
jgi:hypothetical protein